MAELLQVTRPLIDPVYVQEGPNDPIPLGRTTVEFDHKGVKYRDEATVTLRFTPGDRLEFVCPLDNKPPTFAWSMIGEEIDIDKIALVDRGLSIDAFLVSTSGGIVFQPRNSGVTVTHPAPNTASAIFHVFNFPNFSGRDDYVLLTGEQPLQGFSVLGRAVLASDGWNITIVALKQTGELSRSLRTRGGYVITHVGKITRDDGSNFSSDQLEDLLTRLEYFLSFALGRWAGVALPIGFDAQGNRVFEQWGAGRTADGSWNGGLSWFDSQHAELLSDIFPGFVRLWSCPIWNEPVRHAVYWYLAACDRRVGVGVDAGLILAQTALELLAWTQCVIDRKLKPPKSFGPGGLSAAAKLRLLASSLDIPIAIPATLPVLATSANPNWSDGMAAITAIRNSLVHAKPNVKIPEGAYAEAWKLSLWYIELVLLRLCGHAGLYANRLVRRSAGTIEPVPWTQKGPYKP